MAANTDKSGFTLGIAQKGGGGGVKGLPKLG